MSSYSDDHSISSDENIESRSSFGSEEAEDEMEEASEHKSKANNATKITESG